MGEKRNSHYPLILGVDLEGVHQDLINAGANFETDRVIEVGAVLWDWEFHQPVKMFNELIDEPDRLGVTEEIEELTGISDGMLEKYGHRGKGISLVLEQFNELVEQADFLMAHNARGYDRPMLEAMYKRYGLEMPSDKVWIDTLTDIEYPRKIQARSMAMLEHSHGFINPFPHRAVTDALAMLKVACRYDVDRMIKLAKSPRVKIMAQLKAPNWRNRSEVEQFNIVKIKVAKSRFRWDPDNKVWFKEVHKILLDEKRIDFDFHWRVADDGHQTQL